MTGRKFGGTRYDGAAHIPILQRIEREVLYLCSTPVDGSASFFERNDNAVPAIADTLNGRLPRTHVITSDDYELHAETLRKVAGLLRLTVDDFSRARASDRYLLSEEQCLTIALRCGNALALIDEARIPSEGERCPDTERNTGEKT